MPLYKDTISNALNVETTVETTNDTFSLGFFPDAANSNQPNRVSSTLTFNPSTNVLSTTTFAGALTGTASGNTTYTPNNHGVVISGSGNAMTVLAPDASTTKVLTSQGLSADPIWADPSGSSTVSTVQVSTNANFYPLFVASSVDGAQAVNLGTGLTFNPSTNVLTIGGSVAATSANKLSFFAATSSAELAGVISDETGSGALVFADTPTLVTPAIGAATGTSLVLSGSLTSNALTSGRVVFAGASGILSDDADMTFSTDTLTVTNIIGSTSVMSPLIFGGTATTSSLTLKTTSGVGTTNADIIFQVGNNGATEAMRILNSGNVGIGHASPGAPLHIAAGLTTTGCQLFLETKEPTVVANDVVADIDFRGLDSGVRTGARIRALATGTWGADTDSAGTNLQFFTNDNTNTSTLGSPRMVITSTGIIGIGTSSPVEHIHVYSTSTTTTAMTIGINGTGTTQQVAYNLETVGDGNTQFSGGGTKGWQMFANGDSYTDITGVANSLGFSYYSGSGWTDAFMINPSGKVGIGTVLPVDNLHVYTSTTQTTPQIFIEQDSTGDAAIELGIVGDSYILGIDNSDADSFKISYSSTQGSGVLGTNDRLVLDASGNILINGNFTLNTVGNGIAIKEGTNAKMGTATLVAGTVTVNTTAVTANSRIFLTSNSDGGTPGTGVRVSARTAGTSFTITSINGADTSTVAWIIFEPV